jgi:hypothetical protein
MRTMGVKMLAAAKAAKQPPAKAAEVFSSFTQHYGMQQAVHSYHDCPCTDCASIRATHTTAQVEQLQWQALTTKPVVKSNKEQ